MKKVRNSETLFCLDLKISIPVLYWYNIIGDFEFCQTPFSILKKHKTETG